MTSLNEIAELLKREDGFLISSHINPDGDALGSQLALYSALKDIGKSVKIVNLDPVPWLYRFLPFHKSVKYHKDGQRYEPNYLIVLDTGKLERIGESLAKAIKPRKGIINIDHHSECLPFGDLNFIDPNSCATSEIVLRLIRLMSIRLGRERAICLYTGIITDTGGFRFPNTTPQCFRAAADLVEEGVDVQRIYEAVYETSTYGRVKLLGNVLSTITLDESGKIAWMHVTEEMLRQTGTGEEDLEGFIDYARAIIGVEVVMLFIELGPNRTKVSLRSKNSLNVAQIAALFGGGGHEKAAGCTVELPMEKAVKMLLGALREREALAGEA